MHPLVPLEDRILVLRDRVDTLTKAFDESKHPRDKSTGEFTESGGGTSSTPPGTVVEHTRAPKGWYSVTRIGQAVNTVLDKHGDTVKEGAATAVSAALFMAIPGRQGIQDSDADVVKDALLNFQIGAKLTASQARDHMVSVLEKLKKLRQDTLGKVDTDPVMTHLYAVLKILKGLDLEELDRRATAATGKRNGAKGGQPSPKQLNKLEDRLLTLQDRVDKAKGTT